MMEPQIQYVTTSDGVNIAYYAMGQGPALVWAELPSHLQAERKLRPDLWQGFQEVSRIRTLVRYDPRGFGLSERDISAFPLDALLSDLEPVVGKLGLTSFALIAVGGFIAPVAIAFAAAHPERVSQLVLFQATVRIPAQVAEQLEALLLPDSDWRFVSESVMRLGLGWENEETSRALAALLREAITYGTFRAYMRDSRLWDVHELLPSVRMPTLLIQYADSSVVGPKQSMEIASLMPDARATIIDGTTAAERGTQTQAAIGSFLLGADAEFARSAPPQNPQGMAVILFADIVDSTALSQRLGDTAFHERAQVLEQRVRAIVPRHAGAAVEGRTLGDGVLAVFKSAREAIAAALECATAGQDLELELHLGIHAGDVMREAGNVYGIAVNIASRVSDASAPNEVLVSGAVRDIARASAGVVFVDRGEHVLKGIDEPQRLYAVRMREA